MGGCACRTASIVQGVFVWYTIAIQHMAKVFKLERVNTV